MLTARPPATGALMANFETLRSLADYSHNMQAQNRLGALETGLVLIVCGEYLNQLAGGLVMSQNEIMRPQDMGLPNFLPGFDHAAIEALRARETPRGGLTWRG